MSNYIKISDINAIFYYLMRDVNRMNKIWEFFENMNEIVYVVDISNDTIIYMNKKCRDFFCISSEADYINHNCYKILQNLEHKCNACNNDRLKEGYFEERQYYDAALKRFYMLKETLISDPDTGKSYRMEIAFDITHKEAKTSSARSYQDMESLANEGLRLALRAETPDMSINVLLEYIGKSLSGQRTYIFEKNSHGGDDNTYEWVADGVSPEINNLQDVPPEVCASWYKKFTDGGHIIIPDIEAIKSIDYLQYETLKKQNITSLVVVPLFDDDVVIGFYGVDNPPSSSLEYTSDMLHIMGHFIVSCMRRRNLVRQLENMSFTDPLTHLGNRFAMDRYSKKLKSDNSIGVVYCDITGLKRVNDTMGHAEGDQLILRSCSCLTDLFSDYGIFRIGGDELLALCPGIDCGTLENKISLLKNSMPDYDVVMAVGSIWQEDFHNDLDSLLRISEKKMYEDKDAYYKRTGIDRRH